MEGLALLEMLIQTPSEFVNKPDFVLGMVPPSWDVEVHNDRGERTGYREIASPGRARSKRDYCIWKEERENLLNRTEEEAVERSKL